jgi:DNA-binding MarR family transcriptional regulator
MADQIEATQMNKRSPDADADIGILLTLGLRAFIDELHAELGRRGFADLRPAFGVVFRALRDSPLTLTELADQLRVTKQAAAKVVNEMEGKGLLRKRAAADDGRAKLLELTTRGRKATTTAVEIGAQINARVEAGVGPRAAASMRRALECLIVDAGLGDDLARRRSPAL